MNAGSNAAVLCDEFDVDENQQNCNSTPIQSTPDRALSKRIVGVVDHGAYEVPVPCPGDTNGDCRVNVTDLLNVINA